MMWGGAGCRGMDHQQSSMFSYISTEQQVSEDHALRALRVMADAALVSWASRLRKHGFEGPYGRSECALRHAKVG